MRRLALCSTVFAISMVAPASGAGWTSMVAPASGAAWTRPDLRPVTQPAPVGSVLVLYVAEGGGLSLTALDAATGATVWSVDASTSEIPP